MELKSNYLKYYNFSAEPEGPTAMDFQLTGAQLGDICAKMEIHNIELK